MTLRLTAGLAVAMAMLPAASGWAADMPAIKTSGANKVPECVTPGRLTAMLRSRNEKLDPRFEKIAVEYMRRGEELGLRWDYTFYQMILETGHLSYRGDRGRRGDVSPSQNNFAGIGATGGGAAGESFADVGTGVLAHLQHVLLYAGETVDNPVAERTRKVQEWGILKGMQKKAKGPVTFSHLATKWAPGADYVAGLESIAARFQGEFCGKADPHPDMLAEARGTTKQTPMAVAAPVQPAAERVSGAELARQAIAEGKAEENNRREALGTAGLVKSATPSYSLLNAPRAPEAGETVAKPAAPAGNAPQAKAEKAAPKADAAAKADVAGKAERGPPAFMTASAAGAMAKAAPPPAKTAPPVASAGKCRVWTASYGGQKALIIRVKSDKSTDYTVLDVNEGAEKREAEAYIAAYAKGGEVEGEFQSQTQALDKAFELCPEG